MTTISCGVISKLYQEPYCNVYSLMMLPRNKTRSNASQPNPLDRHLFLGPFYVHQCFFSVHPVIHSLVE